MQRNKKSFNLKTLFFFTQKLINLFNKNVLGLLLILPYIFKRLLFPNKKRGRKISVNRRLRSILEFKKARQIVGISLAIILVFSSIIPSNLTSRDIKAIEIEESQIIPELTNIITEKAFRVPVIGYVSQYFSSYHQGVDYAGNNMANIYPIADGVVSAIEYGYFGYGNSVLIDHNNGLISRYAHMSIVSVENGQTVNKETSLGFVGSSGWSTGPHLHLETIYWGRKINPLSLFQ